MIASHKAGRHGRRLTPGQTRTLKSAVPWRDIFLAPKDLCGYPSCSPDSLWRLGYFDKVGRGQNAPPKYKINELGLSLAETLIAEETAGAA